MRKCSPALQPASTFFGTRSLKLEPPRERLRDPLAQEPDNAVGAMGLVETGVAKVSPPMSIGDPCSALL